MNKKFDNNVFHCGQERNIFRKIGLFFQRIRWAWQRATKGYCDWDLLDLSVYYTNLFVNSLHEFANKTLSRPPELTDQEWEDIINSIAVCFEESEEDPELTGPLLDRISALRKEYEIREELEDGSTRVSWPDDIPGYDEAQKEFYKVTQAEYERREKMRDKGFDLMKKWFWDLWW